MPEREQLAAFAATGATLAIHLAIQSLEQIVATLLPHYGAECPIALVMRASWPDARIVKGTLATILDQHRAAPMERTVLILVGPTLEPEEFMDSALYSPDYQRRFRGRDAG
jgi:precorrin-4/cobalt-precorrin-4 C11-methyltransferase